MGAGAVVRLVTGPVFCNLLDGSPVDAFGYGVAAGRFVVIELADEFEATGCVGLGTWTGILRAGSEGKSG